MPTIFLTIQIILGVALIITILLQKQSAGLGGAFGGGGGSEHMHARRGAEKLLFNATIGISILFFLVAILNVMVR